LAQFLRHDIRVLGIKLIRQFNDCAKSLSYRLDVFNLLILRNIVSDIFSNAGEYRAKSNHVAINSECNVSFHYHLRDFGLIDTRRLRLTLVAPRLTVLTITSAASARRHAMGVTIFKLQRDRGTEAQARLRTVL